MAYRTSFASFTGSSLLGAAVLAAALAAPPARAAEPETWYIGVSTADTHVEVFRGLGWEPGGEEHGVALRGGWQLNRRFAVELGVLQAGDLQWTEWLANVPDGLTAHTTFDTTALQVAAVTSFHWGPIVEGYIKAGLARYDVEGRQVLDDLWTAAARTREVSANGSDYLLGAGLSIEAAPKWRVRIEYQYFGLDRDFLGVGNGDDPSIDSFSIGIDYQLPRRKEQR
jgi:opacity protein-like surface antigen